MIKSISISSSQLSTGISFVSDNLEKFKTEQKTRLNAMLLVEESINKLVRHMNNPEDKIRIVIIEFFGSVQIRISVKGEEFAFIRGSELRDIIHLESDDEEDSAEKMEKLIQDALLTANRDRIRYKNRMQVNTVEITVVKKQRAMVVHTLNALFFAIFLGVLCKLVLPQSVLDGMDSGVSSLISTMFLNALKMIVAPVVFFSIVSCISQFTDLREVGRIGAKIMAFYMFTTVIAILVGAGISYVLHPGNPKLAQTLTGDVSSIASSDMSVSLLDTIQNIVPSNFLSPFLESDMLQLIFLAVLVGIAVGKIGDYSATLKNIFEACNALFLKITTMLVKLVPIATFFSIFSIILETGAEVLLSLLAMVLTFAVGIAAMIVVYSVLLRILGGLSPVTFMRKYASTMVQVFSMASSNAAIVVNMEACDKKLGIDKRVYSLSIPLGATVNMDGTCVYLMVFGLALARVYGVTITGPMLLSMFLSVLVLSVGAPGVPGAGLVCLSMLLASIGVPIEAVGLVMGLDSLMGMMRVMNNCLGDVVASAVVAKSEGLIDLETYNKL